MDKNWIHNYVNLYYEFNEINIVLKKMSIFKMLLQFLSVLVNIILKQLLYINYIINKISK